MVAVGSVADVAQNAVPVTLSPQPPGRWRWLGTRTLTFEPEGGRFPMATAYTVEVPAGTRSSAGVLLKARMTSLRALRSESCSAAIAEMRS